ncbi:hypothetical protein NA57DRAFT_57190 [Rhizodiscina lignyota]|uniref:Uncharacterized protein n=1 Tax=Rhizodiscina lignyota TaxID=1504668 RepID=A0A9P4M5M9_9PEZI|nr:hypothetical protein NA57DRAFT_57190 [Rhizodiscina lignyota]
MTRVLLSQSDVQRPSSVVPMRVADMEAPSRRLIGGDVAGLFYFRFSRESGGGRFRLSCHLCDSGILKQYRGAERELEQRDVVISGALAAEVQVAVCVVPCRKGQRRFTLLAGGSEEWRVRVRNEHGQGEPGGAWPPARFGASGREATVVTRFARIPTSWEAGHCAHVKYRMLPQLINGHGTLEAQAG